MAAVGAEQPVPAAPPEPAPASPASSAPPAVLFGSVARPAGGELLQGQVPGPDGRPRAVRVWLPAEYGQDGAARFPVIVVHSGTAGRTADEDLPDVFDGVASAVKTGKARPFVLVAPEARAAPATPASCWRPPRRRSPTTRPCARPSAPPSAPCRPAPTAGRCSASTAAPRARPRPA
ncbi:hypothetical protein [Kitasatospora cheerisanensis]|uniref:hypothetical protein n=1 Tax=Kitasatospora cheerisanensis TaxID=81942 RepID=UPI000568D447|nr:hypothetical protein [Kitasatospora cheerisanensis]